MGSKTKISYCDSTINPMMGCSGCELRAEHCYAAALCKRYAGRKGWPKSFDEPEFFPGRLEKAVGWRDLTGTERPAKPWLNGYPRLIFVNDMSDGFCPDADPWRWLAPSLPAMQHAPHIWLLLTKWPQRMAAFFAKRAGPVPSNFWLGTTITNQADADWRIPALLRIPAEVRFVSAEPLLGKLDLQNFPLGGKGFVSVSGPTGWEWCKTCGKWGGSDGIYRGRCPWCTGTDWVTRPDRKIDWVITGGESGTLARPMHPDWARSLRDQCQKADIAFHFKQWGAWIPLSQMQPALTGFDRMHVPDIPEHDFYDPTAGNNTIEPICFRVGKKRAGRLLDGREWYEMPQT